MIITMIFTILFIIRHSHMTLLNTGNLPNLNDNTIQKQREMGDLLKESLR